MDHTIYTFTAVTGATVSNQDKWAVPFASQYSHSLSYPKQEDVCKTGLAMAEIWHPLLDLAACCKPYGTLAMNDLTWAGLATYVAVAVATFLHEALTATKHTKR